MARPVKHKNKVQVVFLLLCSIAGAQGLPSWGERAVLEPGTLGIPGWSGRAPFEVHEDGRGGLWIRGPAGVLGVDEKLLPRPEAPALLAGTRREGVFKAGGIGNFFLEAEEGIRFFHPECPHGLMTGKNPLEPETWAEEGLPWIDLDRDAGWGLDLLGRVFRKTGGELQSAGFSVSGATSILDLGETLALSGSGFLEIRALDGRILQRFTLETTGPVLLHRVENGMALELTAEGKVLLWDNRGNEGAGSAASTRVQWNLLEAAKLQAEILEREERGAALELLATLALDLSRNTLGSGGDWPRLVLIGRSLRSGFTRTNLNWGDRRGGIRSLGYEIEADDGSVEIPITLTAESIPNRGYEEVIRGAARSGILRIPETQLAGESALRLMLRRQEDIQEIWLFLE